MLWLAAMNQPNVSQTLLRPQGTHQRREICVLREARGGKGKGCQEASSRIRLSVHGISHCARQDQAIAAARCWLVGLAAAKLKCTFVWASCALARAVPAKRDYSECLLQYITREKPGGYSILPQPEVRKPLCQPAAGARGGGRADYKPT